MISWKNVGILVGDLFGCLVSFAVIHFSQTIVKSQMKGKSKGDFFKKILYLIFSYYILIVCFWLGYVYMGVNIVGDWS